MQASTDGRQTAVGFMVQESLLPSPEDLARFKEIDESIVKWMMQHADKEQATRIMAVESAVKSDAEKRAGNHSYTAEVRQGRKYESL